MTRRFAFGSASIVLFAALCTLYELAARSLVITSDQSTVLLQAHSVVSGNFLLNGWHLPSDDFLTLTIGIYAAAERFTGLTETLIKAGPPLLYAFMITLVVLVTAAGLPRRTAAVAGIVVFLSIGLPAAIGPVPGDTVILTEHVETVSAVAGSWLLFHLAFDPVSGRLRPGLGRLLLAVLALVVLVAAALADPFALFLMVLPVIVLAGVELARRRRTRYHARLGGWALGGGVLGTLGAAGITRLGGYTSVRLALHPAGSAQLLSNAKLFATYLVQVSGADVLAPGLSAAQLAFSAIRLLLLLFTVYAAVRTVVEWLFGAKRSTTIVWLALATVILSAAVVVSQEFTTGAQRFVQIVLIMAAPVAAVRIARWTVTPVLRLQALPLLAVIVVACAGCFAPALATTWHSPYPALTAWLQQRGLTQGVSDYWYAAMVNAESGGSIDTVPVFADGGRVVPQLLLADARWLHPAGSPRSGEWFALWPQTSPLGGIDAQSTTAQFGAPSGVYSTAGFVVAVWNTDVIADVNQAYAAAPAGSVPLEPASTTSTS